MVPHVPCEVHSRGVLTPCAVVPPGTPSGHGLGPVPNFCPGADREDRATPYSFHLVPGVHAQRRCLDPPPSFAAEALCPLVVHCSKQQSAGR